MFWVARDKNNWLCLFKGKPIRNNRWDSDCWTSENGGCCIGVLESKFEIFPDVTWETEPQKVSIIREEND